MTTIRKTAATKKTPAASKANTLMLRHEEGKSDERVMAELGLSAVAANASTSRIFSQGTFGELGLTETMAVMREKAVKVQSGDLSDVEATLTAQATTLDTIFNELARRAALNMGEHLPATEIYLRHAFKAQAQCRSTLEALAEIKNPRPVAFVKQANISHGPQQVNNGMQAGESRTHGNNPNQSNELSRGNHELLPDTRTQAVACGVNQEVETVGAIHRAKD
ncbi:hypothetical protein [Sulfuricella sp.]|uniref:hypothetical protein n=1 Tax=Sulfuricella sp. TaxID=2099377 RepID=UPI002C22B7EC|nr:hypothetical protein [Sulfuricella sp.]HUX64789.1 hypothetical protein [Sulfuricella sp.]